MHVRVMLMGAAVALSAGTAAASLLMPARAAGGAAGHEDAATHLRPKRPHIDHATLIQGPFADGPSVTRACLNCHPNAGREMLTSVHWTWLGKEVRVPGHDEPLRIGKKNLLNNFCIGVQPNLTHCTACHAGYGWLDASFDFSKQENIDCLVCHDTSGTYRKDEDRGGVVAQGVNLLAVARSVGLPTRQNCGTCHFAGGGGDAVKHGDLDGTMSQPPERIDVHMGRLNFNCQECHRTDGHSIRGRSMSVSVEDANGVACTDCHSQAPHREQRLNAHVRTVACQTCHIPEYAVETPTKMSWDWSTAGQDRPGADPETYNKRKGSFVYASNVVPEYRWYNGTAGRYLLGDRMDPSQVTRINHPRGDISDPAAKIWPFKVHRGKQIYDAKYNYLLVPKTVGPGGYWTDFNWDEAARLGSAASGLKYSGEYGFAPTEMYWPLSHMVASRDKALQCRDCHSPGGRLDWKALGYEGDPARLHGRPAVAVSTQCGHCHGQVHLDAAPLVLQEDSRRGMTRTTGQIFSGQRLCQSGLNLAGKDSLNRPFDVHAERLLECTSCHQDAGESGRDPRAGSGSANQPRVGRASPAMGESGRRPRHEHAEIECSSCHQARETHGWLPYSDRHLAKLSCEACHIQRIYAPAREQMDRTVVAADGSAPAAYRGAEGASGDSGALIHGYQPVLLERGREDGEARLAPYNLVASWYWVAGDPPKPVASEQLRSAYLDGSRYRPEIVKALDANGDGTIEPKELRLDTAEKVRVVRQRLEALGLSHPHIAADVRPYGLHHDVAGGRWAIRDCEACHSAGSRLTASMELASYVPGGVLPKPVAGTDVRLDGRMAVRADGRLVYEPQTADRELYVAGSGGRRLADRLGAMAVMLAFLGIMAHGTARIIASRRKDQA
jgi:octaheme c-type cytochrome (tetrathionate reductase family)